MFKSKRIFIIASRGGKISRFSYNPANSKDAGKLVCPVTTNSNLAALKLMTYTINQLLVKGETGRFTFVTHDSVAGRVFQYRKAVHNGLDPVSEIVTDNMSDEYSAEIANLVEQLDTAAEVDGLELNFVKMKNLEVWDLRKDGQYIPVSEENQHLLGASLYFVNGVDNMGLGLSAQTNLLTGMFQITSHLERIRVAVNEDGEERFESRIENVLALVRTTSNEKMRVLKNVVAKAWAACPEEDVNFDNIEEDTFEEVAL